MFKFFSTPRYLFNDLWSIEAIRIKETQWGLLDDEAEVRKAKSQDQGFEKRLLIRAQLLSKRLGWQKEQQKILLRARWLFWLWLLLAILVGVGAARAALGADSNQVNIFSAWLVLLLVPTLGLVFWLFSWLSYVFKPKRRFKLNRYWYWLANKMVRGPDAFILLQALFSVLQQQRKMFWLVSWVHHIFWLVALTSATIQLWVTFAFKRYSFFWETTILAPERFIQLAKSASSGLGWLGFNVPDESLIRLSDGLSALPVSGHALWASWLMSCVLIYGVLPRFVLF